VQELPWQRVGGRGGDQTTQGIADGRWHMLGARVEPADDPTRQRLGGNGVGGSGIRVGIGAGCQRLVEPGQERAGCPHLGGVGGVEELARDHPLQTHRDLTSLVLKVAVSRRDGCRNPPVQESIRSSEAQISGIVAGGTFGKSRNQQLSQTESTGTA